MIVYLFGVVIVRLLLGYFADNFGNNWYLSGGSRNRNSDSFWY